jgi:signal transduction histidine kinase
VIEDTHGDPRTSGHAALRAFPNIGCYIAVPVRLSDGTFFGTLCGVDPQPKRFSGQQVELLVILARLLATYFERDQELLARKRAEAALDRLNRLKSEFVSTVSHEFRTALTGIQGFSEMMRDEDLAVADLKEFAGDINKDAKRLNRMISELLDLERIESGRMPLNLARVDLNALIAGLAEQTRPTLRTHTLALELDSALPMLVGDADKLLQVLKNLLTNAIKYSPSGGEIAIGSRCDAESAEIWVRDAGVGIAPDALESIFERYRRAEDGPARGIAGTGLGLPIVRQIVELHGGRVWAVSDTGEGSTFHVLLPLEGPRRES